MSTTNEAAVDYPNFTGYDRDKPMVVYGHVQKALHGKDSNGKPISLLVFRWHLQQRAPNCRFISASIRVVFKDTSGDKSGKTSSDDNLHVRTVAPNGTYGMCLTPDTITRTLALNESLVAGVKAATDTIGANYTLVSQVTATEQVVINGNARSLYGDGILKRLNKTNSDDSALRNCGKDRCNAAEWNFFENTAVKGGLPSMFHTVVLLERGELENNCTERTFQATFTIRTRTNGWMNKLAVWKRYGFASPCKPVTFKTGVRCQKEESAEDKDWTKRLGNADLFQLCKFYLFRLVPANKEDATLLTHPTQTPAEEKHTV